MTRTFTLLNGAMGLDFNDGTSIKADHRGRVVVSDEKAAEIKGSAAMRRYDAILEVTPMGHTSRPDDPHCACGFSYWPWQHECPKCGSKLMDQEA
jgi:hypothetical protein